MFTGGLKLSKALGISFEFDISGSGSLSIIWRASVKGGWILETLVESGA